MQYMDQSGLYTMEDMLLNLKNRNVQVLFVHLASQPRYMMERIKIIPDIVNEAHIFEHFKDCIEWIEQNNEDEF